MVDEDEDHIKKIDQWKNCWLRENEIIKFIDEPQGIGGIISDFDPKAGSGIVEEEEDGSICGISWPDPRREISALDTR